MQPQIPENSLGHRADTPLGVFHKRWFIYLKDHHEGPFSLQEIECKMAEEVVTTDTYIWEKGMPRWMALKEVQALNTLLREKKTQQIIQSTSLSLVEEISEITSQAVENATPPPPEVRLERKSLPSVAVLLGVSLLGAAYHFTPKAHLITERWSEKWMGEFESYFGSWMGGISLPPDISSEDRAHLKHALKTDIHYGFKAEIAVSLADPLSPHLYITTNYPNDAEWLLSIQGISDTLLNQTEFHSELRVTLSKPLTQTPTLKMPDGRPLPKGEYLLSLNPVSEPNTPLKDLLNRTPLLSYRVPESLSKNSTVYALKHVFLGGERDVIYLSRLKAFHEKLSVQAQSEISESKQFLVTLQSQFQTTETQYTLLKQKKAKLSQWNTFHQEWSALQSQLSHVFDQWSSQSLQSDFFYPELKQSIKKVGQALLELHSLQTRFFTARAQFSESQLEGAKAQVLRELDLVSAKIRVFETRPLSQNGMPKRE